MVVASREPLVSAPDDVVIVGAGAGGLAAAIALQAAGRRVRVLDRQRQPGGKMGTVVVDGVEVDTGPSVLTLPEVVDAVLRRAGTTIAERIQLVGPSPAFRYQFASGKHLHVFVDVDETLASVRNSLGPRAADELRAFLAYARDIWDASKDAFIFAPAPRVPSLVRLALARPAALLRIDPFSSMASSVTSRITCDELRLLLLRYATYNGSNPWAAPATLHCIAHVELTLGGFGVVGGMAALARALADVATKLGVVFEGGVDVERVVVGKDGVRGVETSRGFVPCKHVVVNADVGWLRPQSASIARALPRAAEPSTSGATAVLRARRRVDRVAHEVIFSAHYRAEFADLIVRRRPPAQPTLYLCSAERAHGRTGWADEEPLFAMINVPAIGAGSDGSDDLPALARGRTIGEAAGRLHADDVVLWQRGAAELAEAFPGSAGSLYGAASNDRSAAFLRPHNRASRVRGLYLASGSAHPGGGVPLCLQSGLLAADALLRDLA